MLQAACRISLVLERVTSTLLLNAYYNPKGLAQVLRVLYLVAFSLGLRFL
jgi:hypothetical protein